GGSLVSGLLHQLASLSSRYRSQASILLASRRCGRSARLTSLASRRLPQLCSSAAFCQQPAKIDNDSAVDSGSTTQSIVCSLFDDVQLQEADNTTTSSISNSSCGVLLQLVLLSRLVVERLPDLLTKEAAQLLSTGLADLLTSGFELAAHPVGSLCSGFIQLELRLLCEAAHLFQRLSLLSTPVRSSWSSFAGLVAFLAGALPSGMEAQLRQLFDRLLFTPDFVDSLSSDSTGLDLELKRQARDCLATARDVYSAMIGPEIGQARIAGPLLPQDWVWLPLLTTRADDEEEDTDEAAREAAARWAALLDSFGLAPSPCPAARLARLLAVLSASSSPTPAALQPLVAACCQPRFLRSLDTEAPVPGVANFYDAWTDALRHYQGAGYGDAHFANALLIPCGLRHHVKYRRAIWGEMSACLRVLPLRFDQLLLPLEHLLGDGERSLEMLRLYAQELLSSRVTCERSPVPYGLAVHHLSVFLYQRLPDDTPVAAEFRTVLWSHLLSLHKTESSSKLSQKDRQQRLLLAHLVLCDRSESPLLRLHTCGLPAGRLRVIVSYLDGSAAEADRLVSACVAALE
uniref:PI3K/PI4K domain-containing protein n=3 Tax=Macrostomum lignano TaxID=282301 RepID=A0A1I8J251_9PLAT